MADSVTSPDYDAPFEGTSIPTVMFVIGNSHKHGQTDANLYNMTRGNWVIGEKSRNGAKLAFGIADGIIRSVYKIDSWGPSAEPSAPEVAKGSKGRWYFTGHRTPNTDAWIGLSVRHLAPAPGAANPVRLFLGGVTAAARPIRATFAQQLTQEPLAQIMFGNKELFHSNILAWIFNTFPTEADEVFGSFVSSGEGSGRRWVDREKGNLDLVFHWPDKDPLVIENKVFSVPTPDQLDKYAKKTGSWSVAPGKLILLSPTRSEFMKDGYQTRYINTAGIRQHWEHLSFEKLAELLLLAFDGKEPSYEAETVRRYVTVLLALSGLVESTRIEDPSELVFAADGDGDRFLTKQMISSLSKARAERVAEQLNLHLLGRDQPATAYSLFSNALPGVSSFVDVQRDGYTFKAGWQYQGGTFRLALMLPHLKGKGPDRKNVRAAFARKYPEYFSFDRLDSIFDSAATTVSDNKQGKSDGQFNHFDPDFVYRYKKVPNLTVAQAMEAAVVHSQYLRTWSD